MVLDKRYTTKVYFCMLLLAAVFVTTNAQSDVATASWKIAAADGVLNEWQQPLRFYDGDTKLFFDIANDSNTIYLCFVSSDEMTQTKLMRAGMKLTLSTKGKSKREASVLYPLPSSHVMKPGSDNKNVAANEPASGEQGINDKASFRRSFLQLHAVMETAGFTTENGDIPTKNAGGITAAINWDSSSHLVYEIAIPKKEFFGAAYSETDATDDITLSVVINALKNEGKEDNRAKSGGYHGGEGMHNGGMRGAGGGNGSFGGDDSQFGSESDRSLLGQKTSFKQKFALAGKAG